jgi:hypothetical protein
MATVMVLMAYHIKKVQYGEVPLDGVNMLALDTLREIWAGATKITIYMFFDERANQQQREDQRTIFSGKAYCSY